MPRPDEPGYLGKFAGSPDGTHIAFIWDDGGLNDLWVVEATNPCGEPRGLTHAVKGVADFAWLPDGSFCVAADNALE